MWVHADASYAGNYFVCEEYRPRLDGIEGAHSINVNLHQCLTQCVTESILWTADREAIRRSHPLVANMLRALHADGSCRELSMASTNRYKPLKTYIWLKLNGIEGLQEYIRSVASMTARFRQHMNSDRRIVDKSVAPNYGIVVFNLQGQQSNERTYRFCSHIIRSGKMTVALIVSNGCKMIRLAFNREHIAQNEVDETWNLLRQLLDEWQGEEKKGNVLSKAECEHYIHEANTNIMGPPSMSLDSVSVQKNQVSAPTAQPPAATTNEDERQPQLQQQQQPQQQQQQKGPIMSPVESSMKDHSKKDDSDENRKKEAQVKPTEENKVKQADQEVATARYPDGVNTEAPIKGGSKKSKSQKSIKKDKGSSSKKQKKQTDSASQKIQKDGEESASKTAQVIEDAESPKNLKKAEIASNSSKKANDKVRSDEGKEKVANASQKSSKKSAKQKENRREDRPQKGDQEGSNDESGEIEDDDSSSGTISRSTATTSPTLRMQKKKLAEHRKRIEEAAKATSSTSSQSSNSWEPLRKAPPKKGDCYVM